jgi:predicted metal-dependent phosphoesterase TrpH
MIDLHCHSYYSDGSFSPAELIFRARDKGLSAISLTDHDNLLGIAEAKKTAFELNMEFIAGCEISCVLDDDESKTCHVLIYFLENNTPLADKLTELQNDRITRNDRLIARLNELGINIAIEDVKAVAQKKQLGRPHFARALVNKGVVKSVQEAFDLYLAQGKPAYIKKATLTCSQAAQLANDSNAVAVLAHPYRIYDSEETLSKLIAKMPSYGIRGIEAIYSRYNKGQREFLVMLAREHNLIFTGGSDFHGTFIPEIDLGTGLGDLNVPDALLDSLKQIAGR